jgi:GAF domain-containing protein/CheY-like chemotaxis protein
MTTIWLLTENKELQALLSPHLGSNIIWQQTTLTHLPEHHDPLAESENPAVLLVDINHCRLTELPAHLFNSAVPIVAILNDFSQREAVLQNGATDYLVFPFVEMEIAARLAPYVEDSLAFFDFLLQALQFMNQGVSFLQALADSLEGAQPTTWIATAGFYLWDPKQKAFHPLAPLRSFAELDSDSMVTEAETAVLLAEENHLLSYLQTNTIAPLQVIPATALETPVSDTAAYLAIPLYSAQNLMGVIVYRCRQIPRLTRDTRSHLTFLGRIIGHLLEVSRLQEEAQAYAIQTAFIVLVARMLAEESDLDAVLSLTLEHVASLLNASGGDIWLLSADGNELALASAMTDRLTVKRHTSIPMGQGVVGWVAQNNQSLILKDPATASMFDRRYDLYPSDRQSQALLVPLFHQKLLGVIQVYSMNNRTFTNQDKVLLEGVAELLSSAIVNAYLVKNLRESADQLRILYEMSQQLASGLDLNDTLNRSLIWATRLCQVDAGLLWLVDESEHFLELSAWYGLPDPQNQPIHLNLDASLFGDVLRANEGVRLASSSSSQHYQRELAYVLPVEIYNSLILPLSHRDQPLGVLHLINKMEGDFTEDDLMLLSTAKDMIAIAIANSRLYTRTVDLMAEREDLHRYAIQSERLATVGRLTASLSHEINNPMQAIKGAMNLALEELSDPESLRDYLELSLVQIDRVVNLVQRMRQIYRPDNSSPALVQANELLQDAIVVARKEMSRQNVKLETNLAAYLAPIWAIANQLHLVFLNMMLNVGMEMGRQQGGRLMIKSEMVSNWVRIEMQTAVSNLPFDEILSAFHGETPRESGLGFSFIRDIVDVHGGAFEALKVDDQAVLRIELPTAEDAA